MTASPPGHRAGQSLAWADYVAWLVEMHGTLAAAAQRLAALRGYSDDAASIERALRRLRSRGDRDGGTWGERALAAFGLPDAVDARVRWMGAYHSRFTDLPLPLCQDLLRLWDRPPTNEAPAASTWLALTHATCALRASRDDDAIVHVKRAAATRSHAPVEARIELALVDAFIASRHDRATVDARLEAIAPLFEQPMPAADRACLYARWIDQRAYALNRRADHEPARALYEALPDDGPPFARCRRANGLSYGERKAGRRDAAIAYARAAIEHAGDGGHLRLRAMALQMLAHALGAPEGDEFSARALAIARSLDDEALRLRFDR